MADRPFYDEVIGPDGRPVTSRSILDVPSVKKARIAANKEADVVTKTKTVAAAVETTTPDDELTATEEAERMLASMTDGVSATPDGPTGTAHTFAPDGSGPDEGNTSDGGDATCAVCGQPADSPNHSEAVLNDTLAAEDEKPAPERRPHVAAANVEPSSGGWKANPLYFEAVPSRDGRILEAPKGDMRGGWWTDTPKTMMAQFQNPESGGHALAVVAGTMPGTDITRKAKKVLASGRFNTDENGQQAQGYVENGSLTGISVDLAPVKWQIEIPARDGDEGGIFFFAKDQEEPPEGDPIILHEAVDDVILRFTDYEVAGATLVATPAFGDAQVALTADGQKVRIAHPGIGGPYVEMVQTESGWPRPVRVVVGGIVEPWEDMPMIASALRPQTVEDIDHLVAMIDHARIAQLLTAEEARAMFASAIMQRAQ